MAKDAASKIGKAKAVKRNGKGPSNGAEASPQWATGLRRLYDSVLDEPLPDSFSQLLDRLDAGNNG